MHCGGPTVQGSWHACGASHGWVVVVVELVVVVVVGAWVVVLVVGA